MSVQNKKIAESIERALRIIPEGRMGMASEHHAVARELLQEVLVTMKDDQSVALTEGLGL